MTSSIASVLHRGDQASWQLAALAVSVRKLDDTRLVEAAREVLRLLGLVDEELDPVGSSAELTAAQASAPLLQAAAVLTGDDTSWAGQSDEALLAQGEASAAGVAMFIDTALSSLDGLESRLAAPGARILDVGTGVGAMAVAFAETFPAAEVVGIDVSERALGLAAITAARSPAGDRVRLSRVNVAGFSDEHGFDLVCIPAPFVPEPSLRVGLRNVLDASRTGGWVAMGHGTYGTDPVENAISRFKTVAYGGTALDDTEAETMLRAAGFIDVFHGRTPPGAPSVVYGRSGKRAD